MTTARGRPTFAEINLSALRANYRALSAYTNGASIMAVVKADAYGHGAIEVARALRKAGCEHFGVATVEEARELRADGVGERIYLLAGYFADQAPEIVALDLIAPIFDLSLIEPLEHAASASGRVGFRVHLEIDTGATRLGISPMDLAEAAHRLHHAPSLKVEGASTLLANAGDPAQGIALLERSLRINPRDPFAFLTYSNLANAHLAARDYAKGLEWANRAIGAAPDFANARGIMAALWVGLGDIDKAKAALEAARRLTPQLEKNRVKPKPDAAFDVSGGLEAKDAGWGVRHRYQVFIRVASGREDPRAADPLR